MKLNITPGEWAYKGKLVHDTLGFDICDCDKQYLNDRFEDDNAIAIVIAVNNTYHKGINPEAVPEMLEVAKELREWYEKNHQRWFGEHTPIPFSKLLSAIQKATL